MRPIPALASAMTMVNSPPDDGVAIPVLRFDRRWLEHWVQIVRGTARWADVPVIFTGRIAQAQPHAGEISARTLARFRAAASRGVSSSQVT